MMNENLIALANDGKKYVRTTLTDENGKLLQARLKLSTGEIKPYSYYDPTPHLKLVKNDSPDSLPSWMSHIYESPESTEPVIAKKTRQGKVIENPYYGKLDDFIAYYNEDISWRTVLHDIPEMDNYFTGVANLGDSNPIDLNTLLRVLRESPTIDSKTIKNLTGSSDRHCRRIAEALRLLIKLKPMCDRFNYEEMLDE